MLLSPAKHHKQQHLFEKMNWLFGKKQNEIKVKKETENRANKSIEKMNNTIELLEKRQKLLQKKMEQETERAKAFLQKGNKAGMYDIPFVPSHA